MEQKKNGTRKKFLPVNLILLAVLLVILTIIMVGIMRATIKEIPELKWVYGLIDLIILIILITSFAKSFMTVPEGYGIIITFFDAFFTFKLVWKDHTIDKNGNIISIPEETDNGTLRAGLKWVGWPRFAFKVYSYTLDINHLNSQGKPEPLNIPNNKLIRAKRDVYAFIWDLEKNPLRDSEGMPFGMTVSVPVWIINPFTAFGKAERWSVVLTTDLETFIRPFMAQFTLDDIVDNRVGAKSEAIQIEQGVTAESKNGEEKKALYKSGTSVIEKMREKLKERFLSSEIAKVNLNGSKEEIIIQGALVEINQIGIMDIKPSPDYLAKYKATQEAAATITTTEAAMKKITMLAEAQKDARILEAEGIKEANQLIFESAIVILSEKYGIDKKEIQSRINEGELKEEYDKAIETSEIFQSIKSGLYRRFAGVNSNIATQLVDLLKNPIPPQNQEQSNPQQEQGEKPTEDKGKKEMSGADAFDEFSKTGKIPERTNKKTI